MKNIIVIYHKNCPDGMTSAVIAYKKYGDEAEYIACSNRQTPPEYLLNHDDKRNTTVYILDFSYPREVLQSIERDFKQLIVLDHHESAREDVLSVEGGNYRLDRCASWMSYQHFINTDESLMPEYVKMIDTIDLHKDVSNKDNDIFSYINSIPYTLMDYEKLMDNYDINFTNNKLEGSAINRYVSLLENMAIDKFDTVEFEGYTIPAVNMAYDINTKSRILAKLYEIMPPMAMGYRYDEGEWKVSLRGNGSIDVSALAAKYGGGGHKSSAGFAIKAGGPLLFARHIIKN